MSSDERQQVLECLYCTQEHEVRWLCDPAKRVLDAMVERGMSMNMPSLAFPEPIPMSEQTALGGIDGIMAQLVVMAAVVDVGGVDRPALVFGGLGAHGEALPRYLLAGTDEDLRRAAQLVADQAGAAIAGAAKRRGW